MNILLHENSLNVRGTTVALYDYAYFLKHNLNHTCTIVHEQNNSTNNNSIITKFKKEFDVIPYKQFNEIEGIIDSNQIDLFYIIKSGENDGKVSSKVKTVVHSVFCNDVKQMHGSVYAFISEWLTNTCSDTTIPFVPHMINLPDNEENFRSILKIPKSARVFGRHGGIDSFDIPFVRDVVYSVIEKQSDAYFLFCNTPKFIDNPRVIFTNCVTSLEDKSKFINTCDALLHARARGETFGLAILEFMSKSKPVFTFGNSPEGHHYDMLDGQGHLYYSFNNLQELLLNFTPHDISYKHINKFTPKQVMKKFNAVFLQ